MEFPKFTLDEIKTSLKELKSNSATGFDGIQNSFLKNLHLPLVESILIVFNKCMEERQMPPAWKIAKITMIPKKDQPKTIPSKYRPISVTSCLGKLYERLIGHRLYNFLERNNLIN